MTALIGKGCSGVFPIIPPRNLAVIEGFSARLEVLRYDEDAATHTGQLRAELARAGTPMGPYDQMISGHARSKGLILVTNNLSAFVRVPRLPVKDWAQPSATASLPRWSGNPEPELSRPRPTLRRIQDIRTPSHRVDLGFEHYRPFPGEGAVVRWKSYYRTFPGEGGVVRWKSYYRPPA